MASNKRDISFVDESDTSERQTKRHFVEQEAPVEHSLSYPALSHPGRPVPFQQPLSLLTFSYTPSRTLEFTDSALRYYVDPPSGAELRYGYERWVKRPEEKGRIDGLLTAVSKVRSTMGASGGNESDWMKDIAVVSWRGVMTKILTAPYEERDAWEMNVMEVGGTLYLEEHLSDAKLAEKEKMSPHHRLQSYFGYAFESWCTSSTPRTQERLPGHPPGWSGDVDTNVQWCSVVKTKLGDMRMVIGGEVDCVRDKLSGQTSSLVELKTSLAIRGPQDEARFEKKLLKFYFQSFLLGVPEIVVGFRTPSGQLSTVQSFKTMELPRIVREKKSASTLRPVDGKGSAGDRQQDASDTQPQVWRVKFEPRVGVTASVLDAAGVSEVKNGEDRVGFLPRWYWDELQCASSLSERGGDLEATKTSPASKYSIPPEWKI